MKRKVFSLTMALVLLGSLFGLVLTPTPVSGDNTLQWDREVPMPSTRDDRNHLVLGSDVVDLAVASDNSTIWAITNGATANYTLKSIDGGANWEQNTVTGLAVPQLVAIAPDDSDVVVVVGDNNVVKATTNGGTKFSTLSGHGLGNIYCIAVSPASAGKHYIAIGGDDGANIELSYFNLGAPVPMWTDTTAWAGLDGTAAVRAVAFSPAFALDKVMVAVTENVTGALFEIASLSSKKWNDDAAFTDYDGVKNAIAITAPLGSASIALYPTYLGADSLERKAFIGLADSAGADGGIYYMNDELPTVINSNPVRSIDYDGTNLVAGGYNSPVVYRSDDPLGTPPTPTVYSATQKPGGENRVLVAWAGGDVLAGTSGAGSAFALSTDNGNNFTDISLNTAGTDVTSFALAGDNTTVYAADSEGDRLYRSTNAGANWTELTKPGLATEPQLVAVAPDDPDIVVVIADTNEVYASTNSGTIWATLPGHGLTNIYCVDISPAFAGKHYIAVGGDNGTSNIALSYFDLGAAVPKWTDTTAWTGLGAVTAVRAVKFSPNFTSERVMVAVTENGTTQALYEMASLASKKWNDNAGFAGYDGMKNVVASDTSIAPLQSASIALPPTYYATDEIMHFSFVGLATNAADATGLSGIYRMRDWKSMRIGDAVRIHSVAFDGANLVAGAWNTNDVYRCADPLVKMGVIISNWPYQRPDGTGRAIAAFAGTDVVAGTSGDNSAFAVSRDKGKTFNDISLVDASWQNIQDVAVSADGSVVYVAVADAISAISTTTISVWRKASSWARVLSIPNVPTASPTTYAAKPYIIRVAPDDADHVYVADTNGTTMYYSNDAGETKWMLRTLPWDTVDVAVESAEIAYAVMDYGMVQKTENAGFIWKTPAVDTKMGNAATIQSLGEGNLLITGTGGDLAYSTDGNSTWTVKEGPFGPFMSGTVHATASGLANGDYIYAASGVGGRDVVRAKIAPGPPYQFEDQVGGILPAGYYATGMALANGILYVATTNGTDSALYRMLEPEKATSATAWSVAMTTADFTRVPKALKVSAGKVWAIDTAYWCSLYSFMDTLAEDAPTLLSPAGGFQNPVNPVTGNANDVVFKWERVSESTGYDLQIALDSNFSELVRQELGFYPIPVSADPVVVILGPYTGGPATGMGMYYMAGVTYYWRVRASSPVQSPWSAPRSFSIQPLDAAPLPQVHVGIDAPGWVPGGYDFTVTVDINQVENLDACSYQVVFNPAVLRADNVTGGQIGGTSVPVSAWSENVSGTLNIVQNLGGTSGVSGFGHLAVLHFHTIGSLGDSSELNLRNGTLSNAFAEEIPAVWHDDWLYIASFVMGDANGDGAVNALDITKVERIIAGLP